MNYKMIRYIIGMILVAESAFMVLPMLVSVFYGEYDVLMPFVYSILAAFAAGVIFGIKKPKNDLVFAKESYISVAAGWILVSFFGSTFIPTVPSFFSNTAMMRCFGFVSTSPTSFVFCFIVIFLQNFWFISFIIFT